MKKLLLTALFASLLFCAPEANTLKVRPKKAVTKDDIGNPAKSLAPQAQATRAGAAVSKAADQQQIVRTRTPLGVRKLPVDHVAAPHTAAPTEEELALHRALRADAAKQREARGQQLRAHEQKEHEDRMKIEQAMTESKIALLRAARTEQATLQQAAVRSQLTAAALQRHQQEEEARMAAQEQRRMRSQSPATRATRPATDVRRRVLTQQEEFSLACQQAEHYLVQAHTAALGQKPLCQPLGFAILCYCSGFAYNRVDREEVLKTINNNPFRVMIETVVKADAQKLKIAQETIMERVVQPLAMAQSCFAEIRPTGERPFAQGMFSYVPGAELVQNLNRDGLTITQPLVAFQRGLECPTHALYNILLAEYEAGSDGISNGLVGEARKPKDYATFYKTCQHFLGKHPQNLHDGEVQRLLTSLQANKYGDHERDHTDFIAPAHVVIIPNIEVLNPIHVPTIDMSKLTAAALEEHEALEAQAHVKQMDQEAMVRAVTQTKYALERGKMVHFVINTGGAEALGTSSASECAHWICATFRADRNAKHGIAIEVKDSLNHNQTEHHLYKQLVDLLVAE